VLKELAFRATPFATEAEQESARLAFGASVSA
jgi:hypothetical protein